MTSSILKRFAWVLLWNLSLCVRVKRFIDNQVEVRYMVLHYVLYILGIPSGHEPSSCYLHLSLLVMIHVPKMRSWSLQVLLFHTTTSWRQLCVLFLLYRRLHEHFLMNKNCRGSLPCLEQSISEARHCRLYLQSIDLMLGIWNPVVQKHPCWIERCITTFTHSLGYSCLHQLEVTAWDLVKL